MKKNTGEFAGNFYPDQYSADSKLKFQHNYLKEQFSDMDIILKKIKRVVEVGDYTLGQKVDEFEKQYANLIGVKHAIGVGSGTDALFLSLKNFGIGEGDEVITTAFTFYATVGAIVTSGAKPIFVDCDDTYNINPLLIEEKITKNTKAIMPVHWSGRPCDMDAINAIAQRHDLPVIEDACHAIQATYKGENAGNLGNIGCFSFHPLKNLNVWGDGGIITTNSDEHAENFKLLRNHGLASRDECVKFAYNSRLDTVQAVVAEHMLDKISNITDSRIQNANFLDSQLEQIENLTLPKRDADIKEVFHLYMFKAERRDDLQNFLISHGIDAKIHYPTGMHLQPAAKEYGYQQGDFPVCESLGASVISLPVHEFIKQKDLVLFVRLIKEFYSN